jgi:hypothetical protein
MHGWAKLKRCTKRGMAGNKSQLQGDVFFRYSKITAWLKNIHKVQSEISD